MTPHHTVIPAKAGTQTRFRELAGSTSATTSQTKRPKSSRRELTGSRPARLRSRAGMTFFAAHRVVTRCDNGADPKNQTPKTKRSPLGWRGGAPNLIPALFRFPYTVRTCITWGRCPEAFGWCDAGTGEGGPTRPRRPTLPTRSACPAVTQGRDVVPVKNGSRQTWGKSEPRRSPSQRGVTAPFEYSYGRPRLRRAPPSLLIAPSDSAGAEPGCLIAPSDTPSASRPEGAAIVSIAGRGVDRAGSRWQRLGSGCRACRTWGFSRGASRSPPSPC